MAYQKAFLSEICGKRTSMKFMKIVGVVLFLWVYLVKWTCEYKTWRIWDISEPKKSIILSLFGFIITGV